MNKNIENAPLRILPELIRMRCDLSNWKKFLDMHRALGDWTAVESEWMSRHQRHHQGLVGNTKDSWIAPTVRLVAERFTESRSKSDETMFHWLRLLGFIPSYWGHPKRRRSISTEVRMWVFELFGGDCAYCSNPASAIDHVVPLSRGGEHVFWNLAPACEQCNSSKCSKIIWEWYQL